MYGPRRILPLRLVATDECVETGVYCVRPRHVGDCAPGTRPVEIYFAPRRWWDVLALASTPWPLLGEALASGVKTNGPELSVRAKAW